MWLELDVDSSSPLLSLPLYVCTGAPMMYVLQPLCDCALTHFQRLAHWHCCLCPERREHEAQQQTALCHWKEVIFSLNSTWAPKVTIMSRFLKLLFN